MATVRLLDIQEVKQIYETRMKKDFPPAELRPFHSIAALMNTGEYFTLGFEKAGEIAAYACIAKPKGFSGALLDYYAVSVQSRGTGIGGDFLSRMPEILSGQGIDYLILEVESVASAKTPQERDTRTRRIHFYEKNGCLKSGVESRAFGVEYSILYLSFGKEHLDDPRITQELTMAYQLLFASLLKKGQSLSDVMQIWTKPEGNA